MNPNWFGTICAGGALVAFFFCYRAGMAVPKRTRILLALASIVLAIPGASFAAYYAHVLPEPSWYYEFRSWRGTEVFLVMLGVAGGLVASLLPRMLLIVPLFGAAAFAITPIIKPFVGPIPDGVLRDKWDGEVCLQSTPSTCGPASVATIMRSYGVKVAESQLAREAHSYARGTEAWYLARAVRARGFGMEFKRSSGFDPAIPFPAVAAVRVGGVGHFIPILARDGSQFHVGDPLIGREVLSRDTLLERYTFTGVYLVIMKGDSRTLLQ
jgi:hypothetical protein